jgi:hypothetical protein
MMARWLNRTAWLSIALCFVGFVAAFTPYKGSVGALFPLGLALFWLVGVIARRRDLRKE